MESTRRRLSIEDVRSKASEQREQGNKCFNEEKYHEAIKKYAIVAGACSGHNLMEEKTKALCNISLSYWRLKEPWKALVFAEWAVRLNPHSDRAFCRRAQAHHDVDKLEQSVSDYLTSCMLQSSRDVVHEAIVISKKSGCTSLITTMGKHGITVTNEDLQFVNENWGPQKPSKKCIDELVKSAIEKKFFRIPPFLQFLLQARVSCPDLIRAIELEAGNLPKSVHDMLLSIHNQMQLQYMETELVVEAIRQDRLEVSSMFLDTFEIESSRVCISDLLKTTSLCSKPALLQKMLERGANAEHSVTNPIEVVLSKKGYSSRTQLELIHILLNSKSGVDVNLRLEGTTVIHEIVKLTLESNKDDADTLERVCERFPFNESDVVNRDGQTPWHLALNVKRNKASVAVCKVLSKCPIDPCHKDNNGRRADSGRKDEDERVVLLREKETEMKRKEQTLPQPHSTKKVKKKKRKKQPVDFHPQPVEIEHNEVSHNTVHREPQQEVCQKMTITQTSPKHKPIVEKQILMTSIEQHLERVYRQGEEYFEAVLTTSKDEKDVKSVSTQESVKCMNDHLKDVQQEDHVPKSKNPTEKHKVEHMYKSPHFNFDCQLWEIECSEKVTKLFSGKRYGHIKSSFLEKLKILAQGEFLGNEKHCKSVSSERGLELYETRLTHQARIIWQIAVQFSQQCTQAHREANSSHKGYVFSEVIRVWDVVFDHDNIHRCVKNIEKNVHSRGHSASCVVKRNLKIEETSHIAKCVSDRKRYPRKYTCAHPESVTADGHASPVEVYIPPIHPEENQYNIAPLFCLSTSMIKHMLEEGDIERAFPYKEWPQEHDIINMSREGSILLLGRSGTGKTTCCFYRLWNEFKEYWSAGPELELPPKYFPRNHLQTNPMRVMEEAQSMSENVQPQASATTEEHSSVEDGCTTEENVCSGCTMDHLHQVFVTKNYVLCSRLREQFYKFSAVEQCAKEHMSFRKKYLPHDITEVDDLAYPLFLTARQFYILLDFSLHDNNYFFERDESGKLIQKIVSSDYDHEDADICYDLEDSDDEGGLIYQELYPTAQEKQKPKHEITASYYAEKIWPKDPNKTFNMSPLLVWMEIKSFIKGSKEAMESECGYLLQHEYIELGKKRAPNFPGNRKDVYKLFEMYKQYLKSHRTEQLFDECDLIHNLFQRLKKQPDTQWAFHSVYIDEVQDFTQGELWLTLHTCQDPNGFFLTGDTAQSIMTGVSFRFEDTKTIFHCLKEHFPKFKITVPKVQHLVTNFRSHSGILNLAASITDILTWFFPTSFDHENLPRDEGLVPGPIPLFFHSCSSSDLAMLMAGNKQTSSSIDFGAHQAILVRNQRAKEELPSDLSSAIVLTIFESKGLEFDDVLLYNFFTDSEISDEWRTVVSYCDTLELESHTDTMASTVEKPHPLPFQEEKHKQLNAELKHLYTAITRTKSKLWIFEAGTNHLPVLYYWQRYGHLVEVMNAEMFVSSGQEKTMFASTSTPEDWESRGDDFLRKNLWKVAQKCYEKANSTHKVKQCEAYMHFQNAHKMQRGPEKHREYLTAALAFLESDGCEHSTKVLAGAAKCLYNAKEYEKAAQLYMKLQKFEDAHKGYIRCKKYDQCVTVLETQRQYTKAIEFLSKHNMHKAVVHASRYIQQGLLVMQQVEKRVLERGKQLVKKYAEEKQKDKLLSVIYCIPPTLQVKYLKDVKAYAETATALESDGKYTEAYELLLAQGLYARAFQLAKDLYDEQKQAEVVFRVSKAKLVKPPVNNDEVFLPQSHEHNDYEEIPNVHEKLKELSESEDDYKKAVACLLYGKLTKTDQPCREALKLFRKNNNRVGECEAFFALVEISNMKKDVKYIEEAVIVCNGAKAIINAFRSHTESCSASSIQIMHQVEDFYGLKQIEQQYVVPKDQCAWIESLAECRASTDEESSSGSERLWTLDRDKVCKAVCHHLESGVLRLLDNSGTVSAVERSLVPHKFHKQKIDHSYRYSTEKVLDYLRGLALGLEILLLLPPDKVSEETRTALRPLQECFPTLFTFDGMLYLPINEKHFQFIRQLPKPVKDVLAEKVTNILQKHTNKLRVDEWITVWILLHVIGHGDAILTMEMRTRTIKYESERHYFVSVNHSQKHNFHHWIRSCSFLRGTDKALVGAKILVNFIEVIARRRSLRISVSNMVHIMCLSSMTAFSLLALSSPKTVIVVPQLLRDIMQNFDRINCQNDTDKTIFQSCTETCKRVKSSSKIQHTAINCLEKIIKILIGLYKDEFNILKHVTSHVQEYKSEMTPCITLVLTLLGNLSLLTDIYRPSDMLPYQKQIRASLEPVKAQPTLVESNGLRSISDKFVFCTSARAMFNLILDLNNTHHGADVGTEFYQFQPARILRLKVTHLHRIPQNYLVPLEIVAKASGTDPRSRSKGEPKYHPRKAMDTSGHEVKYSTDTTVAEFSATNTPDDVDEGRGELPMEENERSLETASPPLQAKSESFSTLGFQENVEEVKGNVKLESQISGGDISDDEVTEALALEEVSEETVEETLDIDTSEIDSDFCRICGASLRSNVSVTSNAIIKKHIESEKHRSREVVYKEFQTKIKELCVSKKEWEEEVKKWERLEDDVSDALEPSIHDMKEELKKLEDAQNDLQRSCQWEDGTKVLQEFSEKILKILELGREEYIQSTKKEADTSEHVTNTNDEERPHEELSEENLSDIEAAQDPSREKRREKMKKRRQKGK